MRLDLDEQRSMGNDHERREPYVYRDYRVFSRGQYHDRSKNSHAEYRRTKLPGNSAERIVHVRGHPFARCRSTGRRGHRDHRHDATVVRLDHVDHDVVGDGAGIGYWFMDRHLHGHRQYRNSHEICQDQRRRRSGHRHSEPANVVADGGTCGSPGAERSESDHQGRVAG